MQRPPSGNKCSSRLQCEATNGSRGKAGLEVGHARTQDTTSCSQTKLPRSGRGREIGAETCKITPPPPRNGRKSRKQRKSGSGSRGQPGLAAGHAGPQGVTSCPQTKIPENGRVWRIRPNTGKMQRSPSGNKCSSRCNEKQPTAATGNPVSKLVLHARMTTCSQTKLTNNRRERKNEGGNGQGRGSTFKKWT